jgi:cytochrome c biogenesis protein CcdA
MVTTEVGRPQVRSSAEPARRGRTLLIGFLAGLALAVLWSYKLVDDGIGQNIAKSTLGHDARTMPIGGLLSGAVFAFVTGVAGSFTACNIAVFGAVGPMVERQDGHRQSLRTVLRPLGWLVAGMLPVSAVYGAVGAWLGTRIPQLSTDTVGAMPVRLLQSSVVFGVIGLALVYLGLAELRLVPDPLARVQQRHPNARLVVLGALVGGFLIGRPFPLFHKLFVYAAEHNNPVYGAAVFVLQSLGNMVIMGLLFVLLMAIGRGWLVRWMSARPGRVARVTAAMLLTVGVFTVVYWTIRVPSLFGYGWFPTMPYNS